MQRKYFYRAIPNAVMLSLAALFLSGCLEDKAEGVDESSFVAPSGNAPPVISGNPRTAIQIGDQYSFSPSASDPDNDPLVFEIDNKPVWASFDVGSGELAGQPTLGNVGTFSNIRITVKDGQASASLPRFSITVTQDAPSNTAPTISGNPPSQVSANSAYNFTPTASDPDGDDLTFSVSGLPGWATFSNSNGRISGTPGDADVDTYNNIRITVTDTSNASDTLEPFSITVTQNAPSNTAPTISGNPPSQVSVNSAYNFTPTASDVDGDNLTFSVSGLPSWATFSNSNGRISGTPGDADVNTYNNIRITVTDTSNASDTLGPFSITVNAVSTGSVTLSWTPPTQNEDGTTLTDLDGYKIYWGTTPGSYPNSVTIENEGLSSYVVDNLAPGTYEFVATSFNDARVESVYSNPATKVVN